MLLQKIFFPISFFAAAQILLADPLAAVGSVTISPAQLVSDNIKRIVELNPGEKIELEKSVFWQVGAAEFYFFPVSGAKKNSRCRFVFVDGANKKIISDRGFDFERCKFIRPPEIIDINRDGYMDFKVWMKLPHHAGSSIFVNHSLDFIYDPRLRFFCERNIGIPCTSPNIPPPD